MKQVIRLVVCSLLAVAVGGPRAAAETDGSHCVGPSFSYDAKAVIELCTELLKNEKLPDADRARILTLRGRSLKVQKQLNAAIEDFDFALVLKPGDPAIMEMRAWTAIDANDLETADNIAKQLLSANPENATAYNISASAAFRTKQYGAAKKAYDKAINLQPDNVLARFNRLILYKMTGYYRAVVTESDALLALNSPELDTLYSTLEGKRVSFRTQTRLERALAYEALGLTEQTEKAYAEWIAVEPNAVSYGYRAALYWRHEQFDQARADLDKALADDPTFWLLHYTMGEVDLYTDRNEEAIRSYTRSIELNPKSGASFWRRAMAERKLHRADAALQDALKAVAIDKIVRDNKIESLTKLGYLQIGPNDLQNPLPALAEAVQACMFDERCW